jgi:very-short-patch-repair endonuclease
MIFLGELHEPCWLPEEHIVVVDGIRVTKLARLIYDLAGTLKEGRFRRTFANAVSRYPSVLRDLHAMMPVMGRRGRPGIALMRDVLDDNPVGSIVEETGLEGRVIAILAEAGIAVRKQVNVGNNDHWIGRTDLKLVDEPVIIEVDSDLFHLSPLDQSEDAERDEEMGDAGFHVVRIKEDQVWHRPWEVVPAVLRGRAESRAKRGGPPWVPPPDEPG